MYVVALGVGNVRYELFQCVHRDVFDCFPELDVTWSVLPHLTFPSFAPHRHDVGLHG